MQNTRTISTLYKNHIYWSHFKAWGMTFGNPHLNTSFLSLPFSSAELSFLHFIGAQNANRVFCTFSWTLTPYERIHSHRNVPSSKSVFNFSKILMHYFEPELSPFIKTNDKDHPYIMLQLCLLSYIGHAEVNYKLIY